MIAVYDDNDYYDVDYDADDNAIIFILSLH